ncbi:MAG: divalent metal cation transporter [Actinobacteria bacterium]|nr:MAG: divalent metal cation transporter [Actinomycetota bacterium]
MRSVATRTGHHPHRHTLRGFGYFRRLGPGLVTGASDDDPSGIGTYSQAGAAFGFGLLWTAWITLPLAAAVQETAGRLGLVTGQGLAALIKERFPRWVLFGAVTLVAVANGFNIGADLGSMAASVRLLVPVPQALLLVAMAGLMVGLEILLPYERYAKVLRWLTLSLAAYVAVLFVIDVNWGSVLRQTLIPRISWTRPEIAMLIAILGTTISPYLFFWQASEEVEERHLEKKHAVDREHLSLMRADVLAGMASAVLVMFAIMVASAATLGRHGVTTVQTAQQAAEALRPIAGRLASLLFTLGIVGTGLLAVPVLAGSTAYALSEAFGWREGLGRKFRRARKFYLVMAVAMLVGLALNFGGIDPIRALYFAAILNGVAAPPLILLMLILSNHQPTCGKWTGRRWSNALVGLALVLMTALPIAYLVS